MTRPKLMLLYGLLLAAISVLHVALLLPDVVASVPAWTDGLLWSMQTMQRFEAQPDAMRTAGAAFWAAVGGAAMPLLILALLIIHLGRKGVTIPVFVPALLLAWAVACSAIMQPSGFPLIAAVAIGLLISRRATG